MSLIVEDGTGVANANSYVSVADFKTYALARKITVPSATDDCEALLIKAMDYLEIIRFRGVLKLDAQPLQWPRTTVDCWNMIMPVAFSINLAKAQCVLAVAAQTIDLLPATAANRRGPLISQSVYGAVSQTFGLPTAGADFTPYIPQIRLLLRGLLANDGSGSANAIRT